MPAKSVIFMVQAQDLKPCLLCIIGNSNFQDICGMNDVDLLGWVCMCVSISNTWWLHKSWTEVITDLYAILISLYFLFLYVHICLSLGMSLFACMLPYICVFFVFKWQKNEWILFLCMFLCMHTCVCSHIQVNLREEERWQLEGNMHVVTWSPVCNYMKPHA